TGGAGGHRNVYGRCGHGAADGCVRRRRAAAHEEPSADTKISDRAVRRSCQQPLTTNHQLLTRMWQTAACVGFRQEALTGANRFTEIVNVRSVSRTRSKSRTRPNMSWHMARSVMVILMSVFVTVPLTVG